MSQEPRSSVLFDRLREENADVWEAYCNHEFVRALGDASLPLTCFRHYLRQDYVFLMHFARAWALAVYKSGDLSQMQLAAEAVDRVLNHEMQMHVRYCERWGESAETLQATVENTANMAYTRYVLERGLAGDLLDLHIAMTPCSIGYAHIGRRLGAQPVAGNPYQDWIDIYADTAYQDKSEAAVRFLDRLAGGNVSPARFADLSRTFRQATQLEIGFWDMGLTMAQ